MITPILTPPVEGGKIQGHHRDRLAVVYVRQSTAQQVERHQESTRRQYGLKDRALQLGWSAHRVLVLDEDLGKSGASAEGRLGFQRLVAEVSLAQVGIVLGLARSRLARSCRDWHQLLEVCALFGTLIGDLDGVYAPASSNDRLLLGLKGTMGEAELHLLKQRMLAGKQAKAQRGELGLPVPMGDLRRPSGEGVKDPDAQAQAVIELLFEQFERERTVHGVLRYLVAHDIRLPCREASGPNKGELTWRRPNRMTLSNPLPHPAYAGAHGPPAQTARAPGDRSDGGQARSVARAAQGAAAGLHQLGALRAEPGATGGQPHREPWRGPSGALATGGAPRLRALWVADDGPYTDSGHRLRYICARRARDYGEPVCQSLTGTPLDEQVSALVLQALEVSLQVAEDLEAERAQRLERAQYEAQRAFRQFNAVEPEHRLVARTLERQWEAALAEQERLQAEHARFLAAPPAVLRAEERAAIRRLASDIPALWHAPTTTSADRQAIIRQILERIVVTVQGETERVEIQVHWRGGHGTKMTLTRPVARLEQLSSYPQLMERVAALHAQGHTQTAIAEVLNAEGWHPAKRCETFNAAMVGTLLARRGLCSMRPSLAAPLTRQADEWTLQELAQALEMAPQTLYRWLRQGRLSGRRDTGGSHPVWLVRADASELARLRAQPRTWHRPTSVPQS